MSTTREMVGLEDLTGRQVGTLRVDQMVTRRPQPRYQVTCSCGCVTTESHDRIVSGAARCRSSNHNKITKQRERLKESERIATQRQAELEAARLQASTARIEAELDGYERPTKYAPTPDPHVVLTQRQRLELQAKREQEEADLREAERPAREKAERDQQRIAELQAEQEGTLRQLHAIQRERIANGKDDEFTIDPATLPGEGRTGIPQSQVAEWQAAQFTEFLKNNPDYYRCDENAKALTNYIERNVPGGLVLLSAAQLTAAYKRLSQFGLLKERPAPQPIEQPRRVNLAIEPTKAPSKPQPVMFDGWDEDGNPRQYSEREVSRWSSEEMKRRLRLTAASGALELPNIGPGPKGYAR